MVDKAVFEDLAPRDSRSLRMRPVGVERLAVVNLYYSVDTLFLACHCNVEVENSMTELSLNFLYVSR